MRKLLAVTVVVLFIGVALAGCTTTSNPKKEKPPVAKFTVSNSKPTHNEVVHFDASTSTDPDTKKIPTLEFEWDFKDGTAKTTKAHNLIKVDHAFTTDGTYGVTLIVYNNKYMNPFVMNLTVQNIPPKVASFYPPDYPTVMETNTLNFIVNATDMPNNDTLTYQWSVDNQDEAGETGKTYAYIPPYEEAGPHAVSVKINDGKKDGIVFKSWAVNVTAKNRPPTINTYNPNKDDVNIAENLTQVFSVTATDPDGDALAYAWYNGTKVIAGQTKSSYSYFADFDAAGSYVIKAMVSDGKGGIATRSWNMTVSNTNRPPIIIYTSPSTVAHLSMVAMETKNYQFKAIDLDKDPLTYSWTVDTTEQLGAINTSFNYTPIKADVGEHTLTVTVKDKPGLTDSDIWHITVTKLEEAPVISDYTPKNNPTVAEMGIQNFTVTAADPNGDPISYQWYLNGTAVSGKTANNFTFQPDYTMGNPSQKNHIIKVIVTDTHSLTANHTWATVTVTNVDRAPVAKASVNMTSPGIGLSVKFDASASTDPDGDPMTYSWLFADGTPNQGGKTVNHMFMRSGVFNATVTVSDGTLSSQAQAQVNVNISLGWQSMPQGWVSPVVVDDVNNDGTNEIIFGSVESVNAGTYTGFLYIFDGSTHQQKAKSSVDIGKVLDIKVSDVDKDGSKEIIVGTVKSQTNLGLNGQKFEGYAYVFTGSGSYGVEWTSPDIGEVTCIGIGDIDGDTTKEIVAAHGDTFFLTGAGLSYYGNVTIYAWSSGTSYPQKWVTPNFGGITNTMDIGDLDGDLKPDAVIGTVDSFVALSTSYKGRVVVISYTSSFQVISNSNVGMVNAVLIADPDKDGTKDVVAGDLSISSQTLKQYTGHLYIFSKTLVQSYVSPVNQGSVTCIAVADVDQDLLNEIVFGTDYNETQDISNPSILRPEGYLHVLNGLNHNEKFTSGNIGAVMALSLGSIDKTNYLAIAVGTWTKKDANDNYKGYLYVFNYDSVQTVYQQLWKSPECGKINSRALVMIDVDGDGFMDIIFGTTDAGGAQPFSGKIYIFTNKNNA